MISIIIPIFNASSYLNECFKSIVNQDYCDFEVLCIDDGSSDDSLSICQAEALADSRFRVFSQRNSGVSAARNVGLDNAKGDYICFIDADDVVDQHHVSVLLSSIENVDLSLSAFSLHNVAELGSGTMVEKHINSVEFVDDVVSHTIKHPGFTCMLFRRSIIDANHLRFTIGCYRNEDYEFYVKYLTYCTNDICFVDYIGYYYRQNESSAMHQINYKSLTSIDACQRLVSHLKKVGLYKSGYTIVESAILKFIFESARTHNKEMYDYLHSMYDVPTSMKRMVKDVRMKVRIVSLSYSILKRTLFYRIVGLVCN